MHREGGETVCVRILEDRGSFQGVEARRRHVESWGEEGAEGALHAVARARGSCSMCGVRETRDRPPNPKPYPYPNSDPTPALNPETNPNPDPNSDPNRDPRS